MSRYPPGFLPCPETDEPTENVVHAAIWYSPTIMSDSGACFPAPSYDPKPTLNVPRHTRNDARSSAMSRYPPGFLPCPETDEPTENVVHAAIWYSPTIMSDSGACFPAPSYEPTPVFAVQSDTGQIPSAVRAGWPGPAVQKWDAAWTEHPAEVPPVKQSPKNSAGSGSYDSTMTAFPLEMADLDDLELS